MLTLTDLARRARLHPWLSIRAPPSRFGATWVSEFFTNGRSERSWLSHPSKQHGNMSTSILRFPITAGFAGIPGPSATFFGPNEGHDSAVVSAGVSAQLTPAISTLRQLRRAAWAWELRFKCCDRRSQNQLLKRKSDGLMAIRGNLECQVWLGNSLQIPE